MDSFRSSRFFHNSLNSKLTINRITILFNTENNKLAKMVESKVNRIKEYLDEYFSVSLNSEVSIYIYPDIGVMSKAFKREIMSDQWCFVPVKGEKSLITFTGKIKEDQLDQILTHELSHIYFAMITGCKEVEKYKQSVPVWIDEGIALCLDNKYRQDMSSIIENRKTTLLLKKNAYFPKLENLYTYFNRLDENEFGIKAQKAYAYSYFCVKELIGEYGTSRVVRFLKNLNKEVEFNSAFQNHFGKSVIEFDKWVCQKLIGS